MADERTCGGKLDIAARYLRQYEHGGKPEDLAVATALVDSAAQMASDMPANDSAPYVARIQNARRILAGKGAYDRQAVPPVKHFRRCPATDNACPQADGQCSEKCELTATGWAPAGEAI